MLTFLTWHAEKMKKGEALTDDDRLPWLQKLAQLLEQHVKAQTPCVLACSCLKLRYRKVLSGENEGADHAGDIAFVSLSSQLYSCVHQELGFSLI